MIFLKLAVFDIRGLNSFSYYKRIQKETLILQNDERNLTSNYPFPRNELCGQKLKFACLVLSEDGRSYKLQELPNKTVIESSPLGGRHMNRLQEIVTFIHTAIIYHYHKVYFKIFPESSYVLFSQDKFFPKLFQCFTCI